MPNARLPMPKLPPFALAGPVREKARPYYLAIFLLVFAAPLFAIHLPLLGLPFFWDEQGQFIPTALDLLRHGAWIARSTVPNVHPPGVEAYLVVWYKLFGFSIELTRVAMLLLAAFGLLFTFLLAIQLSRGTEGAPAFLPVVFLLASPLFYTQSMMAQLDMPAMMPTLLALLLFLQRKYAAAALASIALVLIKETGIVAPLVFFVVLAWRKDWIRAAYFVAPAAALGVWLCVLHHGTGYWLGNPGFAHYNVEYSLNPVRMALSFARRFYYLFIAEFRWIGTAVLVVAARRAPVFRSEAWRITFAVAVANIVLVSAFGGAELERYLLPVLPIFYIAVSVALTFLMRVQRLIATAALAAGLVVSLFWNPPYPFPYENNLAMVDFVRLQKAAAEFAERNFEGRTIATAWPYTAGLERPDYGFVDRKLAVIETNDFHLSSIEELPAWRFDVLITYTRTWAPEHGVVSIPIVRRFLSRFYQWQPDITAEQCAELGLRPVASWRLRGQAITIYARPGVVKAQVAEL
jgi:Glycosyltransferase family 87